MNYLGIFSSGYQKAIGAAGLDLPRLLLNSVLAGVLSTFLFLISRRIGLYDNLLLLVIVYAAINLPFNQYLLLGFFRAVRAEIEEAGLLDGLARFGCLWRVVLPLILPGLAATAILTLWVTWTDYQLALILTSHAATTMPVGISELVSQYGQLWGVFGAAGITYSVPVVVFCLFAQRHLVSGLTMGSIK